MFQVRSYGVTDIGRRRKQNEDAFLRNDDVRLFVVADGMGGHAAGEIASAEAVDTIYDMFKRGLPALGREESPLTDAAGAPVEHGMRTAAFAEEVVVHSSQIVPLDGEIPLPSAALLACGVITGVGAVLNTARVEPGSTVVVLGCGGVGLNVKMNSRLHASGLFDGVFAFPIPNDSGLGIGAALAVWMERGGARPAPIRHVNLGPSYDDDQIETQIRSCGYAYRRCEDIAAAAAELLAEGKVVAWFQGALEGGPRALGGRSILADPRTVESRDRVNAAIKFRDNFLDLTAGLNRCPDAISAFFNANCI